MNGAVRSDCYGEIDNNLAARRCSNFKLQDADSILTLTYNKLLLSTKKNNHIEQYKQIVSDHSEWKKKRKQHCKIVYDTHKGELASQQAIAYMDCLTEFTDARFFELIEQYKTINNR